MFEREFAATAATMVAPGKGILAKGRLASVAAAQKALFHRAKMNSAACFDRYDAGKENARWPPENRARLPINGAPGIAVVRLWLGAKKPVIMRRHAGRQAILSTANK